MDFLLQNSDKIVLALAGLHVLALAVVNATPTPKDDAFVAKAYKGLEVLAGILTKAAKQ